ncbi:MAG: CHAD domain-containing protein [Chthoniobacterales bacterium]
MSFEIRPKDSLGESIRRLAAKEIQGAIDACCSKQKGHDSPVHETRRRLKRARAALHLLAREVPRKALCRENRRLRNVGRLISNIRDAEVRLATINDLRNAVGTGRDRNLEETEELLAFELDSFLAAFDGWQGEAADKLRRARSAIEDWDLEKVAPARVLRSLRRSYKKGRDALEAVKEKGSARRFHDLRKRAKALWLQLRVLRPLEPEVFRELARELKKLGEDLGHAHDLCFVAERLHDLAGMHPRQSSRKMLETLIESREQDLQRRACRVAERFYAEKPKSFAKRLAKYFEDWPQPNDHSFSYRHSMILNVSS